MAAASRQTIRWTLLSLALALIFLGNLYIGAVHIPFQSVTDTILDKDNEAIAAGIRFIVLQSRLPAAITAIFCGAGLAVSGLLLQTSFRNPLAGPSILGINSGASLGVAIVMLVGDSRIFGVWRRNCYYSRSYSRKFPHYDDTALSFSMASQRSNASYSRNIGRISCILNYHDSEFLSNLRWCSELCALGYGKFHDYPTEPASHIHCSHTDRIVFGPNSCKATRHSVARKRLCAQPWHKHQTHTQPSASRDRSADCSCNRFLRSDILYRTRCATHGTHDNENRYPPHTPPGYNDNRSLSRCHL